MSLSFKRDLSCQPYERLSIRSMSVLAAIVAVDAAETPKTQLGTFSS
jgi:hypothetical protein